MKVLEGANLALRFLLELGGVAALAVWGWQTGDGALRWALALGAPAVAIAVWMLFISPNPAVEVPRVVAFALEVGVWAAAGAALGATGHRALGLAFYLVAVASGALNWLWD